MGALLHLPAHVEIAENELMMQTLSFSKVFAPAECESIEAIGAAQWRYENSLSRPEEGYRSALTAWVAPGPATQLLTERISHVIDRVNTMYRFELSGFREDFLFCRYQEGDGFDWHTDICDKAVSTRKLSISVQLSDPQDYDGGRIEFLPGGEIPFSDDRGSVIVFPSFLCHRVSPVTRGARSAVIAWAHGPAFR
jgi:PKHD-type hydroxylase